jgi:hypothetical protein
MKANSDQSYENEIQDDYDENGNGTSCNEPSWYILLQLTVIDIN